MADCKFCGKPAGLFHHEHKECQEEHESGLSTIRGALSAALSSDSFPSSLPTTIDTVAAKSYISSSEKHGLLLHQWAMGLEDLISDGALDEQREGHLIEYLKTFSISRDEANRDNAFDKLVKAATLRDVMQGTIPTRCAITGNLPINFLKGEQLVWAFPQTQYIEDTTYRAYVGASSGFNVRIAKGLYYHHSAFRGRPIERTAKQKLDSGWFVVTNKNVYFSGSTKSFRVPFPKIVAFQPYTDGMGIMRDAASAKGQSFLTGDGWFTYNLVTNLAKI